MNVVARTQPARARCRIAPTALALLESARQGLADAATEAGAGRRYVAAHLAALRAAAAIVAAKADPHPGPRRKRPSSVWELLPGSSRRSRSGPRSSRPGRASAPRRKPGCPGPSQRTRRMSCCGMRRRSCHSRRRRWASPLSRCFPSAARAKAARAVAAQAQATSAAAQAVAAQAGSRVGRHRAGKAGQSQEPTGLPCPPLPRQVRRSRPLRAPRSRGLPSRSVPR